MNKMRLIKLIHSGNEAQQTADRYEHKKLILLNIPVLKSLLNKKL